MSNSENWIDYPSGLGYDPVEFPLPAGQVGPFGRTTEAVKPRDIGNHISTKVEEAIAADASFQYRGQKNAAQTLAHWAGCLEGLKILDGTTAKRLGNLVTEFAKAEPSERKQFVREKIRPFFSGLRTAKRQP